MPKTKNGGFLLDDSTLNPYTNMCNKNWGNALDDRGNAPYTDMFNKTYGKNSKQSDQADKPKKSATNKRKEK